MAGVELLQLRGQVGQFNPPVDKQTGARIEKEEEKGGDSIMHKPTSS